MQETLLSHSIQPPLLTLLSSTSSPALSPLFQAYTDPSHPNSSIITTLPDHVPPGASKASGSKRKRGFDQHFVPRHASTSDSDTGPDSRAGSSHRPADLAQDVIHIQSPDPSETYIQAGRSLHSYQRAKQKGKGMGKGMDENGHRDPGLAPDCSPLGVELGWVGMQLKRLGRRGMAVEIGVVDKRRREGVVRCSSWKSTPTLHHHRSSPLIHLPLLLPSSSSTTNPTLTQWFEVSLNLPSLIPLFLTLPRPDADDNEGKSAGKDQNHNQSSTTRKKTRPAKDYPRDFGWVSYVRVYANCRVRRIWFAADGDRTLQQLSDRDEWALFAAPSAKG